MTSFGLLTLAYTFVELMGQRIVVRSYLVLLLACLILLVVQWAYPFLPFLNEYFKNSNFITYYLKTDDPGIMVAEPIDSSVFDQLDSLPDSTELLADTATVSDSLPPLAYVDEAWFANDSAVIPDTANLAHLRKFFDALNALKKDPGKKVRISYWGDSMIEGDLITQTIRAKFQKLFGGSGVGFVPYISITAGFRRTVVHKFGGPWEYFSLVKNAKMKKAPFGLNGEYMIEEPDSNSSPLYASFAAPKGKKGWKQMRLFYGKGSKKAIAMVSLNHNPAQTFPLNDTSLVSQILLKDTLINFARIQLDSAGNTLFYGVSLESENGVILDNLSLRGNSGMAQTRISTPMLKGFNSYLKPDLIVLHFGINVISASTMKYGWYEHAMTRVVRHYQKCFPQASILLIGVADKGFKKGDVMVSDPSVYRVLKTQYKVAKKTGVAFWNLYSAMGGEGSMIEWTEAEKPLANKDYTHLNFRGANAVGNMLYDFLMEANKE
ncbi:MAG: hypothetical protein GC180_07685 [Bacteroidetes bacterium]|nr:hypothetical protein [Bacteroidota bacterium]